MKTGIIKKAEIRTVCIPCGQKHDKKKKESFGVWKGMCDMCGDEDVPVADAAHDFGIYSSKEIEAWDKEQDKI